MPWWRDTSSPVHGSARIAPWIAIGGASAMTRAAQPARSRSSSWGVTSVTRPISSARSADMRSSAPSNDMRMTSWNGIFGEHLDRFEGGRHAVGDVRIEERGVLGGDDELDLAEHVEGTAARHALHGGDHWLPAVARLRSDVAARVVVHPGSGVAREVAGRHRVRVRLGDGFGAVDPGAEGSPSAVSTTHRTSSSYRMSFQTSRSSSRMRSLIALRTSGRSSDSHAMPSSLLNKSVSKLATRGSYISEGERRGHRTRGYGFYASDDLDEGVSGFAAALAW